MEATQTTAIRLPGWLTEDWRSALGRAKGSQIARLLWERVFTPAEQRHLGPNLDKAYQIHRSPITMWHHLYGVSVTRAVIDINRRLNLLDEGTANTLLRALDEMPLDPEQARAWAIEKGRLVLVDTEREVYWEGDQIDVNWHKHTSSWTLLWELTCAGKRNQAIDVTMFGKVDKKFLTKSVSRMKKLTNFPASLAGRIRFVKTGTYKLEVHSSEIHLFELSGIDSLREYVR